MLENPDLPDEKMFACLHDAYGIDAVQTAFLPLGADRNTAVYLVIAKDGRAYFLKLRKGVFDELSVKIPKVLRDQGVRQIIAPLPTKSGQLWAELEAFKTILYPYIEGQDGYQVKLSKQQWSEFGAALRKIHTLDIPLALIDQIRRETVSSQWRQLVRQFLELVDNQDFEDQVALQLAAFLRSKRNGVIDLVERAEELANYLLKQPPEFVLCHSDVHAANLLIEADGAFYIVDWDDPILAPKERDLMFIGGAQGFIGYSPDEEEEMFYRGYGQAEIDPIALAYYRTERIIVDIAVYCEDLLLTAEGGENRKQSLRYLMSNFLPGGTIEAAYLRGNQTR